jgi:Protein of unknown function with HXXEE motif
MESRIKIAFLLLVITQGLHSVEEYFGKLWEVLPPARFLSGLVSENLERGFLIINTGLFIFGLWCWLFPVRKNYFFAPILIWFWIAIEMINGIGHPVWALYERTYVPGLVTAPLLLIISSYLCGTLLRREIKS